MDSCLISAALPNSCILTGWAALNLKSDMLVSVHQVAPAYKTSIWLHPGFPGIGIASLLLCRARTLCNLHINYNTAVLA